jgi:SAM-dependent methyltransferase
MPVWEHEAENWVRWAREPGFDAYWRYRDAFFAEIVPSPGERTLDIGCGEGRVSRDLAERGHRVVGVDLSPSLVRYAIDADPASTYVAGDAAALPFPDAAFDVAVGYNSIQNVVDLEGSVRESARVLKPGGRLCICMTHPMTDAGKFESAEPDARFVIREPYLEDRWIDDTFERNGLTMRFTGPALPLQRYAGALQQAGLLVELIREPRPDHPDEPVWLRWERIPMFMFIRAVKPG